MSQTVKSGQGHSQGLFRAGRRADPIRARTRSSLWSVGRPRAVTARAHRRFGAMATQESLRPAARSVICLRTGGPQPSPRATPDYLRIPGDAGPREEVRRCYSAVAPTSPDEGSDTEWHGTVTSDHLLHRRNRVDFRALVPTCLPLPTLCELRQRRVRTRRPTVCVGRCGREYCCCPPAQDCLPSIWSWQGPASLPHPSRSRRLRRLLCCRITSMILSSPARSASSEGGNVANRVWGRRHCGHIFRSGFSSLLWMIPQHPPVGQLRRNSSILVPPPHG